MDCISNSYQPDYCRLLEPEAGLGPPRPVEQTAVGTVVEIGL